eukprot:1147544-Pelagomonas_calceolata.AAC.5
MENVGHLVASYQLAGPIGKGSAHSLIQGLCNSACFMSTAAHILSLPNSEHQASQECLLLVHASSPLSTSMPWSVPELECTPKMQMHLSSGEEWLYELSQGAACSNECGPSDVKYKVKRFPN